MTIFTTANAQETTETDSLYDIPWVSPQPEMVLDRLESAVDIFGNEYRRVFVGTTSNVKNYGDFALNGRYDILRES